MTRLDKNQYLNQILQTVKNLDKNHYNKLKKNISGFDKDYYTESELFYKKYNNYLDRVRKTFDFAIQSYLKVVKDMKYETIKFLRTGQYSSQSFSDVNKKVYDNPEVMDYLLNGLILSQFLWIQHYETYKFFNQQISRRFKSVKNYLEVGAGHGLFLSKFLEKSDSLKTCLCIDISPTSIDFAKNFIQDDRVDYICKDIFSFKPTFKFDFITMGEVLEHVENPKALLEKLKDFLSINGQAFITTPTNAPSIDHIYLFKNINEIQSLIKESGFEIIQENIVCSEDASIDEIKIKKISEMYSALIQIRKP